MKSYHKAPFAIACAVLMLLCAGCKAAVNTQTDETEPTEPNNAATSDEAYAPSALEELGIDPGSLGIYPEVMHDEAHSAGFQLEPPAEGDTIAVIKTSIGDMTLRFFSEQAPKSVTNFINLAKNGSYNNTSFFEVISGAQIKGGHCGNTEDNPNGVSYYGDMFEDEFCDSLCNIRGAVSMANSSQDSNGSRFLINLTTAQNFEGWASLEENWNNMKSQLESYKGSNLLQAFVDENGGKLLNTDIVPENVKQFYETYGGNPYLDGAYNAADRGNTVFAQVIDGMDIADKIGALKTSKDNVPTESVIIKAIEITTYKQ